MSSVFSEVPKLQKEFSGNLPDSVDELKFRKNDLIERKKTIRPKWWHWLLACILGGIIPSIYLMIAKPDVFYNEIKSLPIILAGIVCGPIIYGYFIGLVRTQLSSLLRRIELKLIKLGAEELQEKIEENFFTKLVQINFKYIDQYYLQTQEQAGKSFKLSSFAAVAGLIIIIIGIIMMFFNKTDPAYVTTAAGIISEFISAVFFYLYNRTIMKMSEYHQKLVLTQNISLALKITEDIDKNDKLKVQEMLIDRLTKDTNKYLAGINFKVNT